MTGRTRLGLAALGAALTFGTLLAASAGSATTPHAWTRTGLGAVTQPAPVGSWFVFYAAPAGSLQVIALNAADGTTAWANPATPSDTTAGVYADLAVSGGTIYYLQGVAPVRYGEARVVARDVASNTVVWQSPKGLFTTWPEICPDQSTAICVNGTLASGRYGQLRFDAASGQRVATVRMGRQYQPGRELGLDLFDPGGRSPERILAVSKGKVAWVRRLSTIFTMQHASTDGGWNFDRYPNAGLFVGSVGVRPPFRNGQATVNLGASQTAGFSLGAGRVRWRTRGVYVCGQPLPCPGRSRAGYTSPGSVSAASTGIRFIETGTVHYKQGSLPTFSRDATVSIQGFDPKTGRTRWTYRAGRNLGLLRELTVPPQPTGTTIVLNTRTGDVELHLTTGRTRRVRASSRAWCLHNILYHLNHAAYYRGGGGSYVGQQALIACTAAGKRASIPAVIPPFIRGIGATTNGVTAWTDTRAVHGEPN